MAERSLKVIDTNKTFFSKLTNTITKILIPTKVSFNSIMINIKRNNMLKAYHNYQEIMKEEFAPEKESLLQKYEDTYALYLEAVDKYIIDSVYKKVKNNTASEFEKEVLSKYYLVVSLKEKQYIEYKYRKQEYLLKTDYEGIIRQSKEAYKEKYENFYAEKMTSLYKGLLKNYSIQLTDNVRSKLEEEKIFDKIFENLDTYISEILPLKKSDKKIAKEYEAYEEFLVGKLDKLDILRKKKVLLGISRELFTHSLPLIVAEKCYIKLIDESRELIVVDKKNSTKQNKDYEIYIELVEDYNVKLLSTKVYWDKPKKREEYKKFWNQYKEIKNLSVKEQKKEKQILFLKYDLKELDGKEYKSILKIFKQKLVDLGALRNLKDSCKTYENFTSKEVKKVK